MKTKIVAEPDIWLVGWKSCVKGSRASGEQEPECRNTDGVTPPLTRGRANSFLSKPQLLWCLGKVSPSGRITNVAA